MSIIDHTMITSIIIIIVILTTVNIITYIRRVPRFVANALVERAQASRARLGVASQQIIIVIIIIIIIVIGITIIIITIIVTTITYYDCYYYYYYCPRDFDMFYDFKVDFKMSFSMAHAISFPPLDSPTLRGLSGCAMSESDDDTLQS